MNTYGKIVLENGQKVFKRFGAATKQKIKLGTAAFADIVSNPTKTDVGKVPDASFVAGQQERIDTLNSKMTNFTVLYKSIPQSGMSIAELSEGIYNIDSYEVQKLTDLPRRLVGRTIIITSGAISSSEKIILILNSNSGSMYFGYMYGANLTWKTVNFA